MQFLSFNEQANVYKNKQESDIFYLVQKDEKVKILLSPTLPPPYFMSPFFKNFVTHPPKINELDTVVTPTLVLRPLQPPKIWNVQLSYSNSPGKNFGQMHRGCPGMATLKLTDTYERGTLSKFKLVAMKCKLIFKGM